MISGQVKPFQTSENQPICPLRECSKVGHVIDEHEVCLCCTLPECVHDGEYTFIKRKKKRHHVK